jgi:hypothetical protein
MKVMIAGAGVAALEALIALRGPAEDRVSIELVTSEPKFVYRPLTVAEPFGVGEARGYDSCASPRTTAPHSIWPGSTRWSPRTSGFTPGMAAHCRMTCC